MELYEGFEQEKELKLQEYYKKHPPKVKKKFITNDIITIHSMHDTIRVL